MTHSSPPMPMPKPTPECASFDALLPLLGTDALTGDEAHATQSHLATCAWCHAQRASYDALEAAALRHYHPNSAPTTHDGMRPFQLADILRGGADGKVPDDMDEDRSKLPFEVSPITPATPKTPRRQRGQRSPWRPRLMAEIAAVLIVGLLAAALLVNRTGTPSKHIEPPDVTPPPLMSAEGAVVFTHSVSWGKIQINGRTVYLTTNGSDPVYLPLGKNTLTYHAPPLPVLTCTISAPAAKSDTCPLTRSKEHEKNVWYYSGGLPSTQYKGRIVDLKAVPSRLAPDQREALLTLLQRQFQSFDTEVEIQPGDHYSTPEGRFVTSDRSFKMTLHYDVAPESLGPDMTNCTPYCIVPDYRWSIGTTIHWDFIDQYGKPETVLQGPGSNAVGDRKEFIVRWTGTWEVILADTTDSSSLCGVVFNMYLARAGDGAGGGCINTVFGKYGGLLFQPSGSNPNRIGYALYRGGALIALDSTAHTLAPWMPWASAHERSIARQLGWKG
jgi:hypothetical protein